VSARYVTGTWEPWALTALAFIILVVLWRLLNLAADLIAYGLERTGPGAPMLDTAQWVHIGVLADGERWALYADGQAVESGLTKNGAPAMPDDGEREGAGR